MKIFLITDVHYGENTNYSNIGGEHYVNSFGAQAEKLLKSLQSEMAETDLIINLGDLIHTKNHDEDVLNYKKALALFACGKPVRHIRGNHDMINIDVEEWENMTGEKSYYSFDMGGYHHVMLDGKFVGKKEGISPYVVDDTQIEWLKEDLKKTQLGTLVYCHFALGNQPMARINYFKEKPQNAFIGNKEAIRKIFEDSKKIIAVFNGHIHFFNEETINNIRYFTIPSLTENDGIHQPQAFYSIVNVLDGQVDVEIKKAE